MKPTKFISFPRSGHHWLIRMLTETIGPSFRYSEFYSTGESLESNPDLNAQKDHDIDLTLNKTARFQYVVQVRPFLPAALSWYLADHTNELALPAFLAQQRTYWEAWVWKWIIEPVPNRLIITYDDLIKDTKAVMAKVLKHIGEDATPVIEQVSASKLNP